MLRKRGTGDQSPRRDVAVELRVVGAKDLFGKVLARWGILSIGVGLVGEKHDVKILRPTRWHKKDDIPGMPPLPDFTDQPEAE